MTFLRRTNATIIETFVIRTSLARRRNGDVWTTTTA